MGGNYRYYCSRLGFVPSLYLQAIQLNFTFFIIKPDAVRRDLIGAVLTRMEASGFVIKQMRMVIADRFRAWEHYKEHSRKDFFPELVNSLVDERIVVGAATYRSNPSQSVSKFRELIGPYADGKRIPGTIRDDFAINFRENSIHGSDSNESALRELLLWLPEDV